MITALVRLEWLRRSRRDGFGPLVSCFFFCLALDCCALYVRLIASRDCIFLPPSPGRTGRLLTAAVDFLWLQQWFLPFLLAPQFVAGPFAEDKTRGVLPLLFTTPVTRGEIILGIFLGRISPLLLLALANGPFWGMLAGWVGISPLSAALLAVASLLPILGVGAVSLLASVCCGKNSDAVIALYAVFGAIIVAVWALNAGAGLSPGPNWLVHLGNGLQPFRPGYLLEPVLEDWASLREVARRALIAAAAWGPVMLGCLGLACWRFRPALMNRPEIRRGRLSSRRPAVSDEPIRWKERYRERRMPLALLRRMPSWFTILAVFLATAWVTLWFLCPGGATLGELFGSLCSVDVQALRDQLSRGAQPSRPAFAMLQALGTLLLAALAVGVRSATAISGERESRTWEALLLTPLPTGELTQGKVRGILQSALPYLGVYALAAVPLAGLAGPGELTVTLVALLLTLPVMSVAGAVGINQSARAASSWASIFATFRLIVFGSFATAFVSNFVLGFLALVMLGLGDFAETLASYLPFPAWLGLEPRYQRAFYLLLALVSLWILLCRQASREFLAKAEKWIDDSERTPGLH